MGDKIIRINMSNLTTSTAPCPSEWAALGGRGLTSTVVAAEVPPQCEPLGKYNKLVFSPGLLTGTAAANSGRLSAGFKSPLTGGIKESNAGGTAAQRLEKLAIKAVIIEGMPEKDTWYSIHIDKNGATIKEDTEFIGKGNYELMKAIGERMGKVGVLAIGPAGEFKMAAANISVKDPDGNIRSHGRGGGGAVMGSKKIKYITIDDTDGPGVTIANPDKFKEQARIFAKAMLDHPVTGQGLPTYGTDVLINILNEAGGLPTKNFRFGTVEHPQNICGETVHDVIASRPNGVTAHGCHAGCIIKCSQIYTDKDGQYITSGFEYETIWGFGCACNISDLDDIAKNDYIMDDVGIDSIEGAVLMSVAMEANIIPWGDGKATYRLFDEDIRKGTPLGRVLGNGAGSVGKTYGLTRIPVVKNQGIPAYDPRSVKGIGITYATSTMGADHTAGYTIATNILKVGGYVDPLSKEGQVELSRNLSIATAAVDSTGFCIFVAFPALDIPECFTAIYEMINARYGLNLTADDVVALGKQILKTEHAFNKGAGMTNLHDRLPEFFEEPIPPHNAVWDFTGEEIDEFWNF